MFVFQMGIKMHKLGERCDLFQEGGQVTDPAIDKRMDFHFNAILDVVSEWRKDKSQNQDMPLRGADHECFNLMCEVPQSNFNEWYKQLNDQNDAREGRNSCTKNYKKKKIIILKSTVLLCTLLCLALFSNNDMYLHI